MSTDDSRLQVLLACLKGDKRAGKVHHRLSEQIKAGGVKILDAPALICAHAAGTRGPDFQSAVAAAAACRAP